MEIRKYDPFQKMFREFERYFGRPVETGRAYDDEGSVACAWYPRMDVNERKDEIVVRLDIPGMKQEDIHVTVENGVMTVHGERKFEQSESVDNYHRVECAYGAFSRSFQVPQSVNLDKIVAKYRDGVLTLTLAKKDESKPKQVEIKIG
ncbi:MAG: Hsp20 family protein [Acidobacteria bacterium]|nr:Hsp20 family protein [Acidobacteriota bacterium]